MRRPNYAGVTSTLALFVALSGGAYAATALPANSVGPRQIKKSAVERAKLKDNAVNSNKVLDDSLTGDDIRESKLDSVPQAKLADNATHATTSAALDRVTYRSTTATAPPTVDSTGATAGCDSGQKAVGGGVRVENPNLAVVDDSYPEPGGAAWTAHIATGDAGGTNFTVTVICVPAAAIG